MMAVVAAFVLVLGTPFVAGVLLHAASIRRVTKAALFASVPVGIALLLYVPAHSLDELGTSAVLSLIAAAWVIGFLVAPLPLGVWHLTRVGTRRAFRAATAHKR